VTHANAPEKKDVRRPSSGHFIYPVRRHEKENRKSVRSGKPSRRNETIFDVFRFSYSRAFRPIVFLLFRLVGGDRSFPTTCYAKRTNSHPTRRRVRYRRFFTFAARCLKTKPGRRNPNVRRRFRRARAGCSSPCRPPSADGSSSLFSRSINAVYVQTRPRPCTRRRSLRRYDARTHVRVRCTRRRVSRKKQKQKRRIRSNSGAAKGEGGVLGF